MKKISKVENTCLLICLLLLMCVFAISPSQSRLQNEGVVHFPSAPFYVPPIVNPLGSPLFEGYIAPAEWDKSDPYTLADSNEVDQIYVAKADEMYNKEEQSIRSNEALALAINETTVDNEQEQQKKTKDGDTHKPPQKDYYKEIYGNEKPNSMNDNFDKENQWREEALQKWRNESESKKVQGLGAEFREYRQSYDETNDNKFKKMSIEEWRAESMKEWEISTKERSPV